MKCDFCKNMAYETASFDYPYPVAWCLKGHWEGHGSANDDESDIDPWENCTDFVSEELPQDDGEGQAAALSEIDR